MGEVGFEPTQAEANGFTVRPNWPGSGILPYMMIPAGFEPGIAALKERWPDQLVEGTVFYTDIQ